MIAYQKTSEKTQPSPDKGSVQKWIIGPAWLSIFSGFVAATGIAMAVVANNDFVFVLGIGMFGGGSAGLATIALKSLSFDRSGVTSFTEETPIIYDQPQAEPGLNGRRPIYVARRSGAEVEHSDQKYTWSDSQVNAMLTRVEGGEYRVARDPFLIAPADYQKVQYIMDGRGYWTKPGTAVTWTQAGVDWLQSQARNTTPPPAQ
jgi:hypothetical protein